MNKKIKARWLRALRSGKYRQGQKRLRNTNGTMCCLGVLCDVFDKTKWEKPSENDWIDWTYDGGNETCLPYHVRSKAGLSDEAQVDLMSLNDDHRPNAYRRVIAYIKENL